MKEKIKILAKAVLADINSPFYMDVDDDGFDILVCRYCRQKVKQWHAAPIEHTEDCPYRIAKEVL